MAKLAVTVILIIVLGYIILIMGIIITMVLNIFKITKKYKQNDKRRNQEQSS